MPNWKFANCLNKYTETETISQPTISITEKKFTDLEHGYAKGSITISDVLLNVLFVIGPKEQRLPKTKSVYQQNEKY